MTKLYELLAVEPDLRSQAQEELKRVKAMFTKGQGRLLGQVVHFHGLTEDAQELPDAVFIYPERGYHRRRGWRCLSPNPR